MKIPLITALDLARTTRLHHANAATSVRASYGNAGRRLSLTAGMVLGLTLVLLISTLTGCQANSSMTENDNDALLARGSNGPVLLNVNVAENTLSLSTVSTGCTRAEHFSITVDADGNYTAERTKRDRCRRKPFVVTFEYPLDNLPN